MMGCPVGIDWSVSNVGGQVRIDDVVRYDTVDETEAVRFPGVAAELSADEYRLRVVEFAERAKEPFEGIAKEFADDFERQYEEFWGEFDARLTRAVRRFTLNEYRYPSLSQPREVINVTTKKTASAIST
jgi:hypothetical protein